MDGPPQAAEQQQSPARAMVEGGLRRLGQAIGLTPQRLPPNVGDSPFVQSVAGSSILSPTDGAAAANRAAAATDDGEILQSMIRDFEAVGDGGDSDEEGEEAAIHNFLRVRTNGLSAMDRDRGEELTSNPNAAVSLPGAPPGWIPPQPPEDHVYAPKHDAPAEFCNVDNPGDYDSFSFQAKYKDQKYIGHFTPAGAKIAPRGLDGKRFAGGYEFFYKGWTADQFAKNTYVRGDAKYGNLKPDSRKGCLDVVVLKLLGMNKDRLDDPLFFYQLLFPLCEPSKSGIAGDKRMPYHTQTAAYTNIYAATEGGGVGYGHDWKPVSVTEMIKWEGIPIRHGANDGKPGTHHARWMATDSRHDAIIADNFNYSRYLEVKRMFKLSNNEKEKKRGEEGYDPCNKYDFIYKVLVSNMNNLTKKADPDCVIDETTWGFSGYCAEVGGRLKGKKVDKGTSCDYVCVINAIIQATNHQLLITTAGGQTTMVFDTKNRYPRAYIHRHKLVPKPPGFNQQGPAEMYYLINQIDDLTVGNPSRKTKLYNSVRRKNIEYDMKQVYEKPPHATADNHFSGEHVLDYGGGKGYGLTLTNRRDRFPKGTKEYLHHDKVEAGSRRSRVARFLHPIVAMKEVAATAATKAYTKIIVSFQSTGATNISGVNNLISTRLYSRTKSRGQGEDKRYWGIEMNEGRDLYISTYWGVDNTDHMIKNTNVRYITWKYWHAPYQHAKAMAIVAAYDIYLECCDGLLDPSWKVEEKNRMSFTTFRQTLGQQMLEYDPRKRCYPGDEQLRACTQQHKKRRAASKSSSDDADSYIDDGLSVSNVKKARESDRICETLDELYDHWKSFKRDGNARTCEVCGKNTLWKCSKCGGKHGKPICAPSSRNWHEGCILAAHNISFFGLTRSDSADVHKKNIDSWTPPTQTLISRNKRRIRALCEDIDDAAAQDEGNVE